MKKTFKMYAIIWVILLAVFNAVVFLVRPIIPGFTIGYDERFWISWAFVIAAFIGNLLCASAAFKEENLQKLFYRLPLISVSYSGLILMLIIAVVLMLIPGCPAWIAAVVCLVIAAITSIAIIKAMAGNAVAAIDERVKTQTHFVNNTTINAQNIMNRAKTDEIKAECKRVYEALRYSDPMSNDALSVEEAKITIKMDELARAVSSEAGNVSDIADEIVLLVNERNNKCKKLK